MKLLSLAMITNAQLREMRTSKLTLCLDRSHTDTVANRCENPTRFGTFSRLDWENCCWLLLKDHRRPADSLCLKGDSYLDTVGDPNERNAAVHTIVLAVEGHCPFNLAYAFALAVGR